MIGGTVVGLSRALVERVREATQNLELETPDGDCRPPQVINGFAPPKRSEEEAVQPFVLVCPAEGSIGNDGFHRVKMSIIVGIYTEDFEGHEQLLTVSHKIMQSLRERPTLADRYTLEYPITWDEMYDQPYPYWQLLMITQWTIPTPVILPDDGVI